MAHLMNTKQAFFLLAITLLASSISPIFATESPLASPSDSPSDSPSSSPEWDTFTFTSVTFFITPKYDPKATEQTVNSNQTLKDLCGLTDNSDKCLQFLGNTPLADPAFVMQMDIKVLTTLLNEGSYIAMKEGSNDPSASPETKKGLETCLDNYEKAAKNLDEASRACGDCVMDDANDAKKKQKKCPKETVAKLTSTLSDAVANFRACGKALDTAGAKGKLWVTDSNNAMVDAADSILSVAKKLDS